MSVITRSKLQLLPRTNLVYEGGKPMPSRMAFLDSDINCEALCGVRLSDAYRSPESSLVAVSTRKGALPPGYSAHNFGLAVDLDITGTMTNLQIGTKKDLDRYMRVKGFYCHRVDGLLAHEAWHYNYLGREFGPLPVGIKSTAPLIEEKITRLYAFDYGNAEMQSRLKTLHLYSGDIDSRIGPLSLSALSAFCRAWKLPPWNATNAPRIKRVLWIASEAVTAGVYK